MKDECDHFQQLMLGALGAPLSQEQSAELQQHVEGCATCRAYREGLEADDRALSAFTEAMQPAIAGIETAVMETLQQRRPATRALLPPRFRGRHVQVAAAAALVCGSLLLVTVLLTSLSTPTVTLAETFESMRNRGWIHFVQRRSGNDAEPYEYWQHFGTRTLARKQPSGKITYVNYAEHVMYTYNPYANKVTISFTTDDYMMTGPLWDPMETLSKTIARSETKGAAISRRRATEDSRRVERIQVDYDGDPQHRSTVYVRDVERNLILRIETTVRKDSRAEVHTTTFDYPDEGPADIYALGVPQDATVFDIRPEGPALALVDEVQQRYEQGIRDHLAVILESYVDENEGRHPVEIAVLRRQSERQRSDVYCAFDFQGRPNAPATLYPQVRDLWPTLTIPQVLAIVEPNALERCLLFDGAKTVSGRRDRGQWIEDEHLTNTFKTGPEARPYALDGLIWSNLHLRLQAGSSQFKREVRLLPDDPNRPGLAGLQFVEYAAREDYWFDPSRDYMKVERVRKEEGRGIVSRYAVVRSAQAPEGQWYPSAIEMESDTSGGTTAATTSRREWRVLLDTNPIFDEDVFVSSGPGTAAVNEPSAEPPETTAPQAEPQDETEKPPETSLRGTVRNEQGQPVAEATVLVYHDRNHWGLGNKVIQATETDPDGRFRLTKPLQFERNEPHAYAQDSFVLLAFHQDYAFAWQNIARDRQDDAYELTLTPPTTRVITVTDHNDVPLAGARVWLYYAGERASANPLFRDYLSVDTDLGPLGAATDANGIATITNLPATTCGFHATLGGYAQGLAFSSQNRIRLSPGASVSGWLMTDAGEPVEGATISFAAAWMNNYFLAQTDEHGHFALVDLPARGWDMGPWGESEGASGAYNIRVKHTDYAMSDQPIELLPGQVVDDMVLQVTTESTLIRCVVLEEGTDEPVPGARVAGQAEGQRINGYTDLNGVFEVRVVPGPVSLFLHSPPDGVYVGGRLHRSGDYHARFEAQGVEMDIVLRCPAVEGHLTSVSGTVLGPDGAPAANVVVYASAGEFYTATAGGRIREVGTDAEGKFELKEVPAGRDLHLYAETRDHSLATVDFGSVPVDANESASPVLVLQPTEKAVAVIEDEDGNLVTDRSICLRPALDGKTMWSAERTVRTDSLGVLEIDGIVPGLGYFLRDARFEDVTGMLPEGWKEWFEGKTMVLIPLEP